MTYSVKDSSGYTFDITLKLSPWILLSDTDLINFAWNKVSRGRTLPQFDDWGFRRSGSTYRNALTEYWGWRSSDSIWYITDLYYSVGTIAIKNTTSGFDITQSDPRSVEFPWGCDGWFNSTGYAQWTAGRILYSNDVVTRLNGFNISASVVSNTWGPVPVILITPEYISPNSPNGLAQDILSDSFVFRNPYGGLGNVTLESENIQVHLGILKSDGEYITE